MTSLILATVGLLSGSPLGIATTGLIGYGGAPPPPPEVYHHRLLPESDLLLMLADMGRPVTVNGVLITAEVKQVADDVPLMEGIIESIALTARVTTGQVDACGIAHGSTVVIAGATWYVISQDERPAGWVLLGLSKEQP